MEIKLTSIEPTSFRLRKLIFISLIFALSNTFFSCANVSQMDRETLSDPLMQVSPSGIEPKLQSENFPRREGATGGTSGAGGGCGC